MHQLDSKHENMMLGAQGRVNCGVLEGSSMTFPRSLNIRSWLMSYGPMKLGPPWPRMLWPLTTESITNETKAAKAPIPHLTTTICW